MRSKGDNSNNFIVVVIINTFMDIKGEQFILNTAIRVSLDMIITYNELVVVALYKSVLKSYYKL